MVDACVGFRIPKISPDDPLYGVLTEDDAGIDLNTRRSKISKDVLDEMCSYLLIQDPSEKQARILHVRKSVWDLERNHLGQKNFATFEVTYYFYE